MTTATATPRRYKRSRAAGSHLPDGVLSVTRPSNFGNPFALGMAYELGYALPGQTEIARQAVVAAFEDWLRGNRDMRCSDKADTEREKILARLHELRGRDLACYCPEDATACHADILMKYANLPEPELTAFLARVRLRVDLHRKNRGLPPIQLPQHEEVQALRKEVSRLHLLWPQEPYTESYEYQIVDPYEGISSAENEEEARREIDEAIANYGRTSNTPYAQRRVTRTWDDGSQYVGSYQRLYERQM